MEADRRLLSSGSRTFLSSTTAWWRRCRVSCSITALSSPGSNGDGSLDGTCTLQLLLNYSPWSYFRILYKSNLKIQSNFLFGFSFTYLASSHMLTLYAAGSSKWETFSVRTRGSSLMNMSTWSTTPPILLSSSSVLLARIWALVSRSPLSFSRRSFSFVVRSLAWASRSSKRSHCSWNKVRLPSHARTS